jgi:hypothetical protein
MPRASRRAVGALLALLWAASLAGCDSAEPEATQSDRPGPQCVVADPQGELIVHPGSLTATAGGWSLDHVALTGSKNLDVVEADTVRFTGQPTVQGVILDYPPLKNAGIADSLADWDERQPFEGRRLSAADGQQAVLVVLRLSDATTSGHLLAVRLAYDDGSPRVRAMPQPLLVKPHGRPCTVDDIAAAHSWAG